MLYPKPLVDPNVQGLDGKEGLYGAHGTIVGRVEDNVVLGRLEEGTAYNLIRASFCTGSREEFDRRISQAIVRLEKAEDFYRLAATRESSASTIACRARAQFLQGWISPSPKSRVEILSKAHRASYNLAHSLDSLADLELVCRILGDALLVAREWASTVPYSEKNAKELLSLLGLVEKTPEHGANESNVARARMLCLAGELARQASFWARDSESQLDLGRRAVRLARSAKELTEKEGGSDMFLAGSIDVLLGQILADFEPDLELEESLWREALATGRNLGDHYLIGWSSSLLAYSSERRLLKAEDPISIREIAAECLRWSDEVVANGSIVRFHHAISSTLAGPVSTAIHLLVIVAPDRNERDQLRQQAVEKERLALESATASGSLLDKSNSYHSLSRAVEASRLEESNPERGQSRLLEALLLRKLSLNSLRQGMPSEPWAEGVQYHYIATLLSEIAESKKGAERNRLLARALAASRRCVALCSASTASEARGQLSVHLGRYRETHAKLLERRASETGKQSLLEEALVEYRESARVYLERSLFGHAASSFWHAGHMSHLLGLHEESSRDFEQSANFYATLQRGVPRLSSYYDGLQSYMRAWSSAETAHEAHLKGEHSTASQNYHEASVWLSMDPEREYLSTNFHGWATVERAEDLSEKEEPEKSSKTFQEASAQFEKCERLTTARLQDIHDPEEKIVADKLRRFIETHRAYCNARGLLDDGRSRESRGDYAAAARVNDRAVSILERSIERSAVAERPDLAYTLSLAKGWSALCLARSHSDPRMYSRAGRFFEEAASRSSNVQPSQHAMGYSFLSEALASETRFASTAQQKYYREAKRRLTSASTSFSRARMDHSSLTVEARLSLLDASMYANRAESTASPKGKLQNLQLAEKCLKHCIQLYEKARDLSNREQVEKFLAKISERKRLGRTLKQALDRPLLASPAKLLHGPAFGPEFAVGVATVEKIVQGELTIPQELLDDREFTVSVDLVNTGAVPVSLLELRGLLPPAAKIVKTVSGQEVNDGVVKLNGRLQPGAVEAVTVSCLSSQGLLEFKPRLLYLDGEGKPRSDEIGSATRYVLGRSTFEFTGRHSGALFDFLSSEFLRDYMTRSLAAEASGWRSFPEIMKKLRLPKSALYSRRGLGAGAAELMKRGLIEVRVFPSQPGRGGNVQRTRVCYEKNPVRQYVDRLATKKQI